LTELRLVASELAVWTLRRSRATAMAASFYMAERYPPSAGLRLLQFRRDQRYHIAARYSHLKLLRPEQKNQIRRHYLPAFARSSRDRSQHIDLPRSE
jgi:hypothetical protein